MIEQFLILSDDKSTVHFVIPENIELPHLIEAHHIHQALKNMGVEKYYLFDNEIENIISSIKKGSISELNGLLISQRLDAQLSIDMQEDEMTATMTVTGAYGGIPLRGPLIIEALTNKHILKGINKDNLKNLLLKSQVLNPGETISNIIAVGQAPIAGQDAQFKSLVPNILERILQPQEMDDGHVDMRDLGEVISVKKNTPLMEKIPATLGKNGLTITGKSIIAASGIDSDFQLYPGSSISPSDSNILISDIDGSPLIHASGVTVDNLLTLKNVNATSGHVSFNGSIFVQENIEPGMKVSAEGNITVGGFIENAEVNAKGDVTVMNGIIGRPVADGEALICRITAEGRVTTKLAQNAHIMAHNDIHIALHSNHCELESLGSIFVIDKSEKHGTISGGSATANGLIKTANLGIEGGAYTKVHAFHDFSNQKETLHSLQKHCDDINAQIIKIEQINIERQSPELAEKILRSKEKSNQDLSTLRATLKKEQITFNLNLKQNHVFVTNKIFPRVDIQFNTEHLVTKREYSPSKVFYSGYEIDIEPVLIKKK
ncbi:MULTISPECIES: DUF342 domain-containing protein [Aliivibrio]|uniref:DUF342 domain-containing protein n=1 Tax=Aliivibrio finisterrensis TaxID=511998 RepID=A0A4Q5L2T0_9GAMM|nr:MULTISPECIES: FapA family protein [Aliivibrio]MDD9180066.1 FapA family protein [Aliivibrio sp. A6]RYU52382.1 DUF342 domain-containing protein [Aliivibrio finisterrensis]RYU54984.1 DUF342 domain-containing protein [Aliivibrio finisterrensis]RYU58018.1 DUF342 domain-containing protein [Aliivibrio finisterrensis]RYU66610.1 DUF342 domain-containing protein [Aliivibrio finisterrensis]